MIDFWGGAALIFFSIVAIAGALKVWRAMRGEKPRELSDDWKPGDR